MSETKTNFDILLEAACAECCLFYAKELTEGDNTGFEITAEDRRRFRKILREVKREQRPRMSVGRMIAAACLIALCVSITACVAIPKVRNAIKHAIIEWRDKYITIEFVEQPQESAEQSESTAVTGEQNTPTDSTADTTDTQALSDTEAAKPTTIEKKAFATNLPEGYTYKVDADTFGVYMASYYQGDSRKFRITQKVITQQLSWADSENQTVTLGEINGYQAVLLENTKNPSLFMLVWQDMQYEYKIEGYFSSKDELLTVAEGMQLQ